MKLHKPTPMQWTTVFYVLAMLIYFIVFYHVRKGHLMFLEYDACPPVVAFIWLAAFFIIRTVKYKILKSPAMPRTSFIPQLDQTERELYHHLLRVKGGNAWAVTIRRILTEGSLCEYRLMIQELREDAKDCREVMKNIVGEKALNQLLSL